MAGTNQANETFAAGNLSDSMVAAAGSDTSHQVATAEADASHSLWKAVYEHPIATGVAVGGTALLVGAAIASRGKIAGLLKGGKNEVILFEDSPFFGSAMKETLEQQGNRVTWVTGADNLKALDAGVATVNGGKHIPVHLERFQAAFVDGDLKGGITGAEVVHRLTAEHVTSVGISSQLGANADMIKEGAIAAGLKPSVFGALVNRDVTVAGILKNPGAVQGQIAGYQARYMADETVGRAASNLLKAAMKKMGVG